MREFSIEEKLYALLKRLFKKDKKRYEIIWKKINEIVNNSDIRHYKNLKFPLEDFKRVHIDKSFILIFKYVKAKDKIIFYDFDHHDRIYDKRIN